MAFAYIKNNQLELGLEYLEQTISVAKASSDEHLSIYEEVMVELKEK